MHGSGSWFAKFQNQNRFRSPNLPQLDSESEILEASVLTLKMSGGLGVPPGLGAAGFGDVGQARVFCEAMVQGMMRLRDIDTNVEQDTVNSEKYINELLNVCWEMFWVLGAMFEQEHLRFVNMFVAARDGSGAGRSKFEKVGHHGAHGYSELVGRK